MQATNVPSKFQIPFAYAAGGAYVRPIPVSSQIGIQNGAASLTDGFPPLTFIPEGSGGVPPFGADVNGILKWITQWVQWLNAGGTVAFDGTFAVEIGGYPAGALLLSLTAGVDFWLCTTDNNTANPDTGGAGWKSLSITPAAAAPEFEGTAAVGTSLKYAREDHVHPNNYGGTSTGSANAQVITAPNGLSALAAGVALSFKAGFSNTGALSLTVTGIGTLAVRRDSPAGPVALTGGEVVAGNIVQVRSDGTYMHLVAPAIGSAAAANATRGTGKVVATFGTFVDGDLPVFDGTDGTIKDSGVSPGSLAGSAEGVLYQLGQTF